MPKTFLLSPYDAVSHRLWRESLADYLGKAKPELELSQLPLPPRYFSWRSRGNSLTYSRHSALADTPDLIIATSMTDLAALRGLNRRLGPVPAIVYFHENQFAYPDSHVEGRLERQITSIYTALAADRVFFNSAYNRDSFLEGASGLLAKMPDEVPAGVADTIESRSSVLPVALGEGKRRVNKPGILHIAWNHRWEHDKGPDHLLSLVRGLLASDLDFRFSLFGQQFRDRPPEMEEALVLLEASGKLAHAGYVDDREDYLDQLAAHHIVLSTARHEFQGLAVQEAMNCGCLPVVPDALSYPEYVPERFRYRTPEKVPDMIQSIAAGRLGGECSLDDFTWEKIGPVWLATIDDLLSSHT